MKPDVEEIFRELRRLEENAELAAQTQFEQAKVWKTLHTWISVPAALVAGLLALGTGGCLLADLLSKEVAGGLVIAAAALGAIVVWLSAADRATGAEASANEYLALQGDARVTRIIDLRVAEFGQAREMLAELLEQQNSINRQAPTASRVARKRAARNVREGGLKYNVDRP
jgi:hypothetical protein